MSLLSSLYTGSSGLFVNQKGIEVSGNNVSNVNTPGYSRQTLRLSPSPTLEFKGQMIGQGTTVAAINRETDSFVLGQLNKQGAEYGEANAKTMPLTELERIIGIDSSGLDKDINNFFDAWKKLNGAPSGDIERQQVMQEGKDLADQLQKMVKDLNATADGINDKLEGDITNLNRQLKEIAALNSQISSAESTGISANALRDQRDRLIQEISETTGARSYPEANGMVSLQLTNGIPLVSADKANKIETTSAAGTLELQITNGASTSKLDRDDFGGAIKGQLDLRDETIPETIDKLDQLAFGLANAVNAAHNGGIDANGNAGQDFFSYSSGAPQPWSGAAATLSMNLTNHSQIAAGSGATYLPGDNSNCLTMAELQDKMLVNNSTLNDYYNTIASDIGLEVSQNKKNLASSKDAMVQLQNMRDDTSGVSIDEEMLMLIQYQTGYEAAAKYLSTVDEMLNTLMQL